MTQHGLETGFLTDVMLPLSLAVIMFGMGLSLRVGDFRRIGEMPRAVVAGLVGQLLLLPLAAMATVALFVVQFDLSIELAMGLLLLAAVPGGATSNLLTYLGKGDHALSITLTSIVSLGAVVLTPGVVFATSSLLFGDPELVQVSFGQMAGLVLLIVALPVGLGMWINARWPGVHPRVDKPLRLFGALFLAGLVALIIYENRVGFWGMAADTVPAALVLNVLALAAGVALGWYAKLPEDQRRCLAFEVGFQNGTLGIVLAVTQLGSTRAALMPGFYSLVMFATGGLLAWAWARREPDTHPPDRPRPGPDGVDFDVVVSEVRDRARDLGPRV